MSPPVRRDDSNLISVGSTLLYLSRELGLFHYNKLVYLFEYFYIKNFGKRFTKEAFIKLTHGPVIVGYKNHIEGLVRLKIAKADIQTLKMNRDVDDTIYPKFRIVPSVNIQNYILRDHTLFSFVQALIDRFGGLPILQLEKVVYDTGPMKAYSASQFKKETGSYILSADCIKMKDYSNEITEGRRRALDHLRMYPKVNYEQQERLAAEFSGLSRLRPPL
jgi:Protein of unknown function (DUF4065)